jgi:hypothetical protein
VIEDRVGHRFGDTGVPLTWLSASFRQIASSFWNTEKGFPGAGSTCRPALTAANGRRPIPSHDDSAPSGRRTTPRRDKVRQRRFRGPRPTGRRSTTNSRVARHNRAQVPAARARRWEQAAPPQPRTRRGRTLG